MSTTPKEILKYLEEAEASFDENKKINLDKDYFGFKSSAIMSITIFHYIKKLEKEISLLKKQLKDENSIRN